MKNYITELKTAVSDALALVERVAEQQAMADDSWKPEAEKIRKLLDRKLTPKEAQELRLYIIDITMVITAEPGKPSTNCPHCNSTKFSTQATNSGAGEVANKCSDCGHQWISDY